MPDAMTPTAFAGWFRPRKGIAWTRLVEAPTYDAALSALLGALARLHGGDTLIVRAGQDPNRPSLPRYVRGGKRML